MLKKLCKSISLLFIAMLMASSCVMGVFAASDRGSISITMRKENGDPLPGGELTIYYVAIPAQRGADWYYDPVNGFKEIKDLDLTVLTDETAQTLSDYTKTHSNKVKSKKANIGTTGDYKGKVFFNTDLTDNKTGLRQGLYLVVQTKAANGYQKINPFLVTIPFDGKLNVDATPKSAPAEPTPPGGGGSNGGGDKKPPLIQTGQLNWPVPVLAGSGILLFMLGWILVFSKRERYDA